MFKFRSNVIWISYSSISSIRGSHLLNNKFDTNQKYFSSKSDINNQIDNKSMSLRYCNASPQDSDKTKLASSSGRLAVLMAWMLAEDAHIEKYRRLYFRYRFDVLTVKTSPFSLIFPSKGSQIIAKRLLDNLNSQMNNYTNVVVHGFSVGAYQFAELIIQMNEMRNGPQLNEECNLLEDKIKGVVFDSALDFDRGPHGFSRAITNNAILAPLLEYLMRTYMDLFYNISTKHYKRASNAFYNLPLRCPALLLCSQTDKVGDSDHNMKLAKLWRELGIDVRLKCWPDSQHVSHIVKYPDQYSIEIESFLKKINLNGYQGID